MITVLTPQKPNTRDRDADRVLIERKREFHVAAYAYGAFGPLTRTGLDSPDGPCVRHLLADGRGNTAVVADGAVCGSVRFELSVRSRKLARDGEMV